MYKRQVLNCETVLTPPVAGPPVVTQPAVVTPPVVVTRGPLKVELVKAKFDSRGRLILTVRCPAASAGACADTLKVQAKVKRRTVSLASKRYSVGAGKQATLAVTLSRTQVRKAAKQGKLAFTVLAATGTKAKAFSLKLPKKR